MNPIIAANWKMNLTIDQGLVLIDEILDSSSPDNFDIIFFPSSHIYCCNNIISCEMIFTKNIYRVHSVWRGIQNEENERRHKRRLYFGWKRILETEITHPERGSLITISIFALPPSFQKNQSSKITKPGADKSNQY